MKKLLLFFPDIQEAGVAHNWTTLNRRIRLEGFPPGGMMGRRRVWTLDEVKAWLEQLPTENRTPLKGAAKKVAARRGEAA